MSNKLWWYLLVTCAALAACQTDPMEHEYLYQMEQDTLLSFWKSDLDHMVWYLGNAEFPSYSFKQSWLTGGQLHGLRFTKVSSGTDSAKLVLDPARSQIIVTQPSGFDFTVELYWEYNLFLLPISGTAIFSGHASDLAYIINITQPFEGRMFLPALECKWKVDSATVNSPIGNLFSVTDFVQEMFAQTLTQRIHANISYDLLENVTLRYQQYYAPQPDFISFPGLGKNVQVMRRYRRVVMDPHSMAVVYQERAERTSVATQGEKEMRAIYVPAKSEGSGVLRRYMRDLSLFGGIAKQLQPIIKDYTIQDKDLPKEQKLRLDATSMQMMVPDFKMRFGNDVTISLHVSGLDDISSIGVAAAGTQEVSLSGLALNFAFYVSTRKIELCFLNTTVLVSLSLVPKTEWKDGTLAVNFDVKAVDILVQQAESKVFGGEIVREGIRRFLSQGMLDFFVGKCQGHMLGDGLKMRDELGSVAHVGAMVDISGFTFNTWIYQQSA